MFPYNTFLLYKFMKHIFSTFVTKPVPPFVLPLSSRLTRGRCLKLHFTFFLVRRKKSFTTSRWVRTMKACDDTKKKLPFVPSSIALIPPFSIYSRSLVFCLLLISTILALLFTAFHIIYYSALWRWGNSLLCPIFAHFQQSVYLDFQL